MNILAAVNHHHVSVRQTVIEKHKMNVPETMNEVLDMSDDEGEDSLPSLFTCASKQPQSQNPGDEEPKSIKSQVESYLAFALE